ncbi:MAG: hypothetical protein H8E28_04750 [Anaerolineae bacterium]|nr:hypothetical protein [Anaerolineae bacterium]MBL6965145.1 hypothetical protein [Anaerolineales bacterium]
MPQTQISCPNCRQPIMADVNQLFDVAQEPQAKQNLLSGMYNLAQCPHCGYQGNLATPIVYHDPEKELLLTFFPPELNMPRNEQERLVGPLIKRVVDNLPQEKRKGYLFSPKTMLTFKGMIELILEADGISKEMLDAQEKRMGLIQRLMETSPDGREALIEQEDALIDDDFFTLFSRLAEVALMSNDSASAEGLRALQETLLSHSTKGRQLKNEAEEINAARQALEAIGQALTREVLLDLIVDSPNAARTRAYVQMVRPGLDYQFFQMLSERIDSAAGDEKQRLETLRAQLLELTQDIDRVLEQRKQLARKNLNSLLEVDDIAAALQANLGAVDEFFVEALTEALEEARQAGDLARSEKLGEVMAALESFSAQPPEMEFVEELLELADDEDAVKQLLQSQTEETHQKLSELLMNLMTQVQASAEQAQGDAKEQQLTLANQLQKVFNIALQFSMEKNLKG